MSNQIYADDQNRYQGSYGVTMYRPLADRNILLNDDVTVKFDNSIYNDDKTCITNDPVTGLFTINIPGFYSINFTVLYEGEDPTTSDTDIEAKILLTRSGSFTYEIVSQKIPGYENVTSKGINERALCASVTVLLEKDDVFSLYIKNNNKDRFVTIKQGTQIQYQKLF